MFSFSSSNIFRLAVTLMVVLVGIHESVHAESLCQQFKSGQATVAVFAETYHRKAHKRKILLLDSHLRGYHITSDRFIHDRHPPPRLYLNLTRQPTIHFDHGGDLPEISSGRGAFYYHEEGFQGRLYHNLALLWRGGQKMSLMRIEPTSGEVASYRFDKTNGSGVFLSDSSQNGMLAWMINEGRDGVVLYKFMVEKATGRVLRRQGDGKEALVSGTFPTSIDGGFRSSHGTKYTFSKAEKAMFIDASFSQPYEQFFICLPGEDSTDPVEITEKQSQDLGGKGEEPEAPSEADEAKVDKSGGDRGHWNAETTRLPRNDKLNSVFGTLLTVIGIICGLLLLIALVFIYRKRLKKSLRTSFSFWPIRDSSQVDGGMEQKSTTSSQGKVPSREKNSKSSFGSTSSVTEAK